MEDVDIGKIGEEIKKIPEDVRQTILIYLRYYAFALARESMKCDSVEDIKFRDGGFAVIKNLTKVLEENRDKHIKKLA